MASCSAYRALRAKGQQSFKSARYVGHDLDPAVASDVFQYAGMAVHPGDPLTVGRIVRVEQQRESPYVERKTRGDRLHQLADSLSRERRNAQGGRVHALEARSLVARQSIGLVVHLDERHLGRSKLR